MAGEVVSIGAQVTALLEQFDAQPLGRTLYPDEGVYGIWCVGPIQLYSEYRERLLPLYIGKTDTGLATRLQQHASTLEPTLGVLNFASRSLGTSAPWTSLIEAALIARWDPLWNRLGGFGHSGGAARIQYRPTWHVLHPDHPKYAHLPPRVSRESLIRIVKQLPEVLPA